MPAGTEEIYRTGANLSVYEKLKSRVDYLVQNEKYASAVLEYEVLLGKMPEEEKVLTSKIRYNMGVALCGLIHGFFPVFLYFFLFFSSKQPFQKAHISPLPYPGHSTAHAFPILIF